ncbi:MAG: prepilin-type N-terminal cleavage/methylation domain-containing protein [Pseudohongiella sp.]|nr:prepilin-type N-terminal cleavage/methylation domain-containing protein [Pseudohongiella sp.]MDO9521773.1 prepilin-type N-terminal cleavage/methylation domain-containing protein [Pseudohongiella sp.]
MRRAQYGLTLVELLISVAISMSMALVLIQVHLQTSLSIEIQQSISRRLENAATLQHILSHSLRDVLFRVDLTETDGNSRGDSPPSFSGKGCPGVVITQQCTAPVTGWRAGAGGAPTITAAASGSDALQVKQDCCPDVVADQFYLAHRGGVRSNPISLYRRRVTGTGSYLPATELVEDVSELAFSFIVEDPSTGDLALVDVDQVPDWWRLKAVRIQYRLQNTAVLVDAVGDTESWFSFTVAGRQWQKI